MAHKPYKTLNGLRRSLKDQELIKTQAQLYEAVYILAESVATLQKRVAKIDSLQLNVDLMEQTVEGHETDIDKIKNELAGVAKSVTQIRQSMGATSKK